MDSCSTVWVVYGCISLCLCNGHLSPICRVPSVCTLGYHSRLSLPCFPEPARLLPCFGTQTHTLLEAQIKGSTPLPASQWTLCAEGSQLELGSKETGRGGGALHKDTCHSEKPSEDGVKKAPGGGRAACCWDADGQSLPLVPSGFPGERRQWSGSSTSICSLPSLRCCDISWLLGVVGWYSKMKQNGDSGEA